MPPPLLAGGWGWSKSQNMEKLSHNTIHRQYCRALCVCVCVCGVTQSCLTLCDPMDYSPPGSSAHGIFQTRILEWVASSFSRGSSWPRGWAHVSCIGRRMDSLPPVLPGEPNTESSAIGATRNNTLLWSIPCSKSICSAQKWKIWTLNKARQVKGHNSSEDEGPLRAGGFKEGSM